MFGCNPRVQGDEPDQGAEAAADVELLGVVTYLLHTSSSHFITFIPFYTYNEVSFHACLKVKFLAAFFVKYIISLLASCCQ